MKTSNMVKRIALLVISILAITSFKLLGDSIALVMKTGVVAMFGAITHLNMDAGVVPNYLATARFDITHYILEAVLLSGVMAFYRSCRLNPRRFSASQKFWVVLGAAVLFEVVCFGASLLEFLGNGIWSAITSTSPSIVLRNKVSATRWANIDYILRFCEGWLMLKVLQVMKARIRHSRKAKKTRDEEGI